MRRLLTWLMLMALGNAPVKGAQLQFVTGAEPQAVFAGSNRVVRLCWRNAGTSINETEIQSRMTQLTSATAVWVGETPWKKLQVLPGQTVLESATLDFPPVRAETRFLVEWLDGDSHVLGSTDVLAYPTNLLAELGVLAEHNENALGIFDPENELKPLLRNLKIGFTDLENMVAEKFCGTLALVGPFGPDAAAKQLTTTQIKSLVKNGVRVVWVTSRKNNAMSDFEKIQPSFYWTPQNPATAVVVQPAMLGGLADNPRAQLNLIFFCKLALRPQLAERTFPMIAE